ncbi:hypothetical protein HU200_023863 [Digitaria exilis]|uniref:WAT1-related protein n=1 Tax=Digitaria exilis TaxID=1010633 RepID=A0A835C359_9POAL|nr:hypothetical protein HU200_023863 [Digitaria exilis]
MTLVQLIFTIMYFIAEAAFNKGLNSYVYVTYQNLLASVLLWPFAYFYEKKLRPKMTIMLFLEIFVLSLLGASLTVNMHFTSLKYTSPAFVTSTGNAVPSITFFMAIILRMENVDIRSLRGLAKIAGTVVSFAGVTTMTLYKGTAIKSPWKAPIHTHGSSRIHGSSRVLANENWVKGSFHAVASCITWSIWCILQVSSMKRYPANLSLTAWISTVGGIQSAVFAVFMQPKLDDWLIGFSLKLWCIVYTVSSCSGFSTFIQLYCTKKKDPVFVTMFNPLLTIIVGILAYFIFGENLYFGSIIGGVLAIPGLYMLLWGKDKDQEQKAGKEQESELDCEKQVKVDNISSC